MQLAVVVIMNAESRIGKTTNDDISYSSSTSLNSSLKKASTNFNDDKKNVMLYTHHSGTFSGASHCLLFVFV